MRRKRERALTAGGALTSEFEIKGRMKMCLYDIIDRRTSRSGRKPKTGYKRMNPSADPDLAGEFPFYDALVVARKGEWLTAKQYAIYCENDGSPYISGFHVYPTLKDFRTAWGALAIAHKVLYDDVYLVGREKASWRWSAGRKRLTTRSDRIVRVVVASRICFTGETVKGES